MTTEPLTQPAAAEAEVLDDEVLVERLVEGETPAGEELARRYFLPLMRYLTRLSGNEHVAEELHQQTWLSALDHLERFDARQPGGFKAWLFRIATNKANDYWRSRGREQAVHAGLRLVTEEVVGDAGTRLESSEQLARLREAIDRLPAAQKQVVLLRYYSGMKFVDIARVVGCPVNTALGRMHKAAMKLKEAMQSASP